MENTEVKEYISEEDCDIYVSYLISKGLNYQQALEVVDVLSRMINTSATRIAKDMGAI